MRDGDVGIVAARNQSEWREGVVRNVHDRGGDPGHGAVGKQVYRLNRAGCAAFLRDDELAWQNPDLGRGPIRFEQAYHSIQTGSYIGAIDTRSEEHTSELQSLRH